MPSHLCGFVLIENEMNEIEMIRDNKFVIVYDKWQCSIDQLKHPYKHNGWSCNEALFVHALHMQV